MVMAEDISIRNNRMALLDALGKSLCQNCTYFINADLTLAYDFRLT